MINYHYQLISPRKIVKKVFDEDIQNKVVVKPKYFSICQADQRYFQGKRKNNILKQKLPLTLIHEGVGEVVLDNTNNFQVGDTVVLLPNIVIDRHNGENYNSKNKFMSSDTEGFMQENIIISPNQLLKFDSVDSTIAVFCELLSVAIHAIESIKNKINIADNIGIWGSGNLGYLIHLYLNYKFPKKNIYVFGTNDDNLEIFGLAKKRINIYQDNELPKVDLAFEAVGGNNSNWAINQIIECINSMGTICLLGVSEDLIQINTRMILEKGLTLIGRSRSMENDFKSAIDFLENESNWNKIRKITSKIIQVNNIADIEKAFDYDYTHPWKTIIDWNM